MRARARHSAPSRRRSRRPGRCLIRRWTCRWKSPTRSIRRWPGPMSRAGATTIISRPTGLFASAASRSRRRTGQPCRIPRRWAPRCAIPAASPRGWSFPTARRPKPSSRKTSCRFASRASAKAEGFVTGYYEPILDGSTRAKRGLQGADLSPPVEPVRQGTDPGFGRAAQQGRGLSQDRPPQARAVLRPRRDRGRRDRGPRAGNRVS